MPTTTQGPDGRPSRAGRAVDVAGVRREGGAPSPGTACSGALVAGGWLAFAVAMAFNRRQSPG